MINIKKYPKIVGYGAPAKATTILNFYGINKEIDYLVDDNPLKSGKYVPGVQIPIQNTFKNEKIDLIIVFAWNYFNEIKLKTSKFAKKIISIKDLEKKNFNLWANNYEWNQSFCNFIKREQQNTKNNQKTKIFKNKIWNILWNKWS